MGRAVMLSNGEMLVGLNEHGLVHDFYYPYVGLENLTTARSVHHMIGLWVEGKFSWLDDGSWDIRVDFETDSLVSNIVAEHDGLKLRLHLADFVDCQYNAFCRQVSVENLGDNTREVRLFMHQVFQISNEGRADTALYVPDGQYLFDYKGRCSLLISARDDAGQPFDQFSVGNYGINNKEGTFRDAEDGELSGNLVEHGGVDSVLRCVLNLGKHESKKIDYWVVASYSQYDAESIHRILLNEGLSSRLERTRTWWVEWLKIAEPKYSKIDEKYQNIFKKSLLVIKSHIDKRGGIIASCDSSIYNYGKDYYSYVWPRDSALTALTLMDLGYSEEPRRFLEFCSDTIHPSGYMMHKYQPDRAIGSTWHPLMNNHHPELAIQEDETASVVYAACYYYEKFNDLEFAKKMYKELIAPACNFMTRFIDETTGLPHPSYDLWEERFATHTYTVALTVASLRIATKLAIELGEDQDALNWKNAADGISDNMKPLFDTERNCYRKSLLLKDDGTIEYDNRIDASSFYGIFWFDDSRSDSQALIASVDTIKKALLNQSPSGGVVRYENDMYFLDRKEYIGNPWFVCTFWLAQYDAKNGDKESARATIDWALERMSPSGMMPEQVDPLDNRPKGVSPLVWSHAELINTLLLL